MLCIISYKTYYTKIPVNLSTTFNYCTQTLQNLESTLIMNVLGQGEFIKFTVYRERRRRSL